MKNRNVRRNLSIILSLSLLVSVAQGRVIAKLPDEHEKLMTECREGNDDKDKYYKNDNNRVYTRKKKNKFLYKF